MPSSQIGLPFGLPFAGIVTTQVHRSFTLAPALNRAAPGCTCASGAADRHRGPFVLAQCCVCWVPGCRENVCVRARACMHVCVRACVCRSARRTCKRCASWRLVVPVLGADQPPTRALPLGRASSKLLPRLSWPSASRSPLMRRSVRPAASARRRCPGGRPLMRCGGCRGPERWCSKGRAGAIDEVGWGRRSSSHSSPFLLGFHPRGESNISFEKAISLDTVS
jgi:hypothetical protein